MKAVVVISPGVIEVRDVPEPVIGNYDVLCEILASSICNATDHHILHNDLGQKLNYPLLLGHEAIGRVIKCGPKVKYIKKGDVITRIINRLPKGSNYAIQWGALAERGVATDWEAMRDDAIPETRWGKYTIHRVLPAQMDPLAATLIITWRETYAFFKRMSPKAGETLLIIGSGAQALAFSNHAHNRGLQTVVIGSPERKNIFLRAHIKSFVSYHTENLVKALYKRNFPRCDIVVDTVGNNATLNQVLPVLIHGGKIGMYGFDEALGYSIFAARSHGDFSFYHGAHYDEGSAHDDIISFINEGKLDAWHYLSRTHIYPLEKIKEALEASRKRKVIKSIIRF